MAVKNITMSVLTRLKQQAKMDELISRSTKDIDFMVYRLSKENLDSIDRKSKNVIQLYYKGDDVMAKEATLQVRMDAELKEKVEALYKEMGTSFAEAVRIFAKQSIQENGMPFVITANHKNTYGRLAKYANPGFIEKEAGAMERAMINKHEETD